MKEISFAFVTVLTLFIAPTPALAIFNVSQGGTGVISFPTDAIILGNGTNPLNATYSPTVDHISATSSSATSTFSGNLSVNGLARFGSSTDLLYRLNGILQSVTIQSPLTFLNGILSCQLSSDAQDGCLSAVDWQIFDSKFATSSTNYWLSTKTTDDVQEGSTNKYFTDARAGTYIASSSTVPHVSGDAFGDLLYWTGAAWASVATSSLGILGDSGLLGTENTWSALQNFSGGASTTLLTVGDITIGINNTVPTVLSANTLNLESTAGGVFIYNREGNPTNPAGIDITKYSGSGDYGGIDLFPEAGGVKIWNTGAQFAARFDTSLLLSSSKTFTFPNYSGT